MPKRIVKIDSALGVAKRLRIQKSLTDKSPEEKLRHWRENARCHQKDYNPQPIHEMTEKQAWAFSMRQAIAASLTICMTDEELMLYAGGIYGSIRYFNERDTRHREHMAFLEECRVKLQEMMAKQREEKKAMKRKPKLIEIK